MILILERTKFSTKLVFWGETLYTREIPGEGFYPNGFSISPIQGFPRARGKAVIWKDPWRTKRRL